MNAPRLHAAIAGLALALTPLAHAASKAQDKWVERVDCQLVAGRFADGDSFVLEWKDQKGELTARTYRLYGVDCPESDATDKAVKGRITEQAVAFRVDAATLLRFGKEAANFTQRALKRGKVRLLTRGPLGQEVPKHTGRAQRRYAMVEVLDEDRRPRWLHQLLLEKGLARAHGRTAAWPPQEEDRHGVEAAEREFGKELGRIELRARQAKAGIWAAAAKPGAKRSFFPASSSPSAPYPAAAMKQLPLAAAVWFVAAPFTLAAAPDTSGPGWTPLFQPDYSDAQKPEGVWSVVDGALTASADEALWTKGEHERFLLDLEFKNAAGTNSGVIVYCSDTKNWIPKSVEIQIADDFAEKWAKSPASWHCGAIFGHVTPTPNLVKKPGEWNKMTIEARGKNLKVWLNGQLASEMDMAKWTSAKQNPDGSEIPPWLSTPLAEMPTKGRIGFQGKHGDATIWFRNIRIKRLGKAS